MTAFSTALVTGGTGFLGRALCRHLIRSGVKTTLLTRSDAAAPEGADYVRVPDLGREVVGNALRDRGFDVIFHLTAYGVSPADRDPSLVFDTNVGGTDAIVRAGAEIGVRAIVYVGSCSEYKDTTSGRPIVEDAPLTSTGFYGVSKAVAGMWGTALADRLGVAFQWIRLFNVFGPGESAHRLIPTLITGLSADRVIALSPGEQVRDFLYVDDVVRGLILAAQSAMEGHRGPFNLCSGQAVTIKEIALAVAASMNKPSDLLAFGALDYRPDDIQWLVGQPESFQQATGFRPDVSLKSGIERMIAARAIAGSASS